MEDVKVDASAVAGLRRIVDTVRNHRHSGQGRRLVAFLAGVYNGPQFPFDLSDLRPLDRDLSDACLAVLNFDRLGMAEIHHWGVVSAVELESWFTDQGLYYRAEQARIGAELYLSTYGEAGHPEDPG